MLPTKYEKEYAKINSIFCTARFEQVALDNVLLDRTIKKIISEVNLVSFLKGNNDDSFDELESLLIDAYQAPILCYEIDGKYFAFSGVFTYMKSQRLRVSNVNATIPCLIVSSRPKPEQRKLIFLNDVLRIMLKQYFNVSGDSISKLLNCLFLSEENIFKTEHWQMLFPKIKTKTEFCKWLKISNKVIKL
ncbi:hypothetical protein [Pseudoalteromonas sp. PA2MD11]|uniref:hypothetical protein n=1 Tax=Pseudoalteromonas sp. PA2MD11 TaxID=2785057 RepID=UPI001ADF1052|nr:hypothetical protein [Pseudoalteromonas sp. PA2MD11]